ncbi:MULTISPECIES: TetR/AcrR family transcriptional regulator [unclassified Bacillus (in: firmicutes)]|uniref:TetR/AcrR family transcriptional regulator n=1 Tax=unclassified Bacillus (in: firmicutes) TaxID=185979 RepID=UPI0008E30A7D|nr:MULTISPECIES: TetR/AcrR family transcriptional regulator [unclassified Bacillus (in: firmicutes)]SFB09198.1 DNA-binding transcriptional regulator, AcrR family [Bacillus sp. UNCCL13]SFQ86809.1 DNA-binding transcriptional regulator, AcrR family [Bacillus sp. cl95]
MIKKQLIMEKALELFASKGIESTSIQQITEHCGISKGAFYLSFKSKDELVLALIDHFMMEITYDIDRVVKEAEKEELLSQFYFVTFDTFHKHSDFAKVLIKEQAQSFNEEFILKTRYYDGLMEQIILSMIERLYGDEVKRIKYDLIYCIKGFMRIYSELFLFYNVDLDLNLLSKSLVEKTNLLARHTTIPFISEELIQMFNQPMNEEVTKEQILETVDQKIEELEESIEKESLILLSQQLNEPTLNRAIVKGLIENIRNHPHCKWVSYLLRTYFGF